MLFASRPFRVAIWILLVFLIILVGSEISFIFRPVVLVARALFFPIALSGLMYYWFYPVVDWLVRRKVPRVLAIILVYCTVISIFVLVFAYVGPILQKQVASLVSNAPRIVNQLRMRLLELEENEWVDRIFGSNEVSLEALVNQVTSLINNILLTVGQNITPIITVTANVFTTILIVPFLLFYMLLDGHKLPDTLAAYLPKRHRKEARTVLYDLDKALSAYIQGQALVSCCVGLLALLGYLVIGLDYALILAVVATVTNVVPFVGPIIGTIPAVIVGIIHSPGMAWRALIVMIVVQQIESLVVSPRVMGKKFSSHPVGIIVLILAAGKLAGLLGIFLAIPTYAVVRVVISHAYSLVRLYREQPKTEAPKS